MWHTPPSQETGAGFKRHVFVPSSIHTLLRPGPANPLRQAHLPRKLPRHKTRSYSHGLRLHRPFRQGTCHNSTCHHSLYLTHRRPWRFCGTSPAVRMAITHIGMREGAAISFGACDIASSWRTAGALGHGAPHLPEPATAMLRCQTHHADSTSAVTGSNSARLPGSTLAQAEVPPQSMSDSPGSLALLWHESWQVRGATSSRPGVRAAASRWHQPGIKN